jgi:hypothetical protein
MNNVKEPTVGEYLNWLRDKHGAYFQQTTVFENGLRLEGYKLDFDGKRLIIAAENHREVLSFESVLMHDFRLGIISPWNIYNNDSK